MPDGVHRYRNIAALGSSFAAGPSIDPIIDERAKRSGNNYPALLAKKLQATLTDLTVSGATTDNILYTPQQTSLNPFAAKIPPQIEGVPSNADLVTITAGGNNLGYSASMMKAALSNSLKSSYLTCIPGYLLGLTVSSPTTDKGSTDSAVAGLVAVIKAVRAKAPSARIILVDYLAVFGTETRPNEPNLPLSAEQISLYRAAGRVLDEVFEEAARQGEVELVKASGISHNHAIGCAMPWVTAFSPTFNFMPFHPNQEGMQAVAEELYRTVTS